MVAQRETRLQARIVRDLERKGIFAIRQRLQGRRGWPDLYAILPCCGRALQVEVKMPGGRPTRLQTLMLEKLAGAGAETAVASSTSEVLAIVEGHSCGRKTA